MRGLKNRLTTLGAIVFLGLIHAVNVWALSLGGGGGNPQDVVSDTESFIRLIVKIVFVLGIMLTPITLLLVFAGVSAFKAFNKAKNDQVENPSMSAVMAAGKVLLIGGPLVALTYTFVNKFLFGGQMVSIFTSTLNTIIGG